MRRSRLRLVVLFSQQEQPSEVVRNGGLRQSRQAAAPRGAEARGVIGRLAIFSIALMAAAMLTGCSPVLETDQARLCRMALPALIPQDARIAILTQAPDVDGRGLKIDFTAQTQGEEPRNHLAACRFRLPGRPHESRDLTSLTLDGQPLSETQLFFLVRYWLATPEGRAADPAPLGDLSALPVVPHAVAYGLQM